MAASDSTKTDNPTQATFRGVTLESSMESFHRYEKLAERIGEQDFEGHVVQCEVIVLGREIERLRAIISAMHDARDEIALNMGRNARGNA